MSTMATNDEIRSEVKRILREQWTTRTGYVVPEPTDLRLTANDGVELDAAVMYADIIGSSDLVRARSATRAAEVYKTFLYSAGEIIRRYDGVITAYDGDRVMAIFIGSEKCTKAMRCALALNWVVKEIINKEDAATYPKTPYLLRHAVGIDMSKVLAARSGVWGNNDIVWVGNAANFAAKMSALRTYTGPSFVTQSVYDGSHESVRLSSTGEKMWSYIDWPDQTNRIIQSTWFWKP